MYASALPLGALIAWISNFFELKSDSYKLAHLYKRPFSKGQSDIGTWKRFIDIICMVSVV